MQCVELYAEPTGPTFDKPKAAMKSCIEGSTCIGVKKTSKNEYQELRRLTGYIFNGTCKDYYLWDKSRGVTFRHQPHELEAAILYAIYPNRECPTSFDVAGSLCRGLSSVTENIYGTYPSYMAP
uniref:Uncharacterized protein n=1 Tax=Panagrolaimus sp. PS1159 TaxID=55785 RepID=A0AC35EWI2_9BILA